MTEGEDGPRSIAIGGETRIEDAVSVDRLYAELATELRRFVLGVIRDPELANDVMQATFVKAIEHGHQARPETARGWLFQVAFRESLTIRRRLIAQQKSERRLANFRLNPDTTPEVGLLQGETVDAVRKALKLIPEEQRRVILARIYEEKTFAQIAKDQGLPLGTVLTRMRRGLDKLRNSLRPGG